MIRRMNESNDYGNYVTDKLSKSLNESYDVDMALYAVVRSMKENQFDFGSLNFDNIQEYINGIKSNLNRAIGDITQIEKFMDSYYE